MEVKRGYKLTEVGVIPNEWDAAALGSIASFSSGNGINIAALRGQSTDYPVPVFGGNGVAGYTNMVLVRERTVVVGRVGQKCGEVYVTEGPSWISDNALFPRRMHRECDVDFFGCALQAAGLNDVKNRNDLPLVTQSILHAKRIAWPPTIIEQRTIATALSDVDVLLGAVDRLIAKKRDLKQAAMQQLLAGQTRLPGFRGEWARLNMAENSTLKARIGWQGLTTAEYRQTGDYFLVTGTDFSGGRIAWTSCCYVDVQRYTQDRNIQLRAKDILLTKDGTIGKVAFVDELPGPATLNSGVFVIRPKDDAYDPRFFFYILSSRIFENFLTRLQAGSTITHLYQKDFVSFSFLAPATLREQEAIARVLSEMDEELIGLEQRREKTLALKQGMMQELLTGRTRLV